MNTTTFVYSVLENGMRIPARFPVGSFVRTQWGYRKVVANRVEVVREEVDPERYQGVQ